jgi:hypothetical protein
MVCCSGAAIGSGCWCGWPRPTVQRCSRLACSGADRKEEIFRISDATATRYPCVRARARGTVPAHRCRADGMPQLIGCGAWRAAGVGGAVRSTVGRELRNARWLRRDDAAKPVRCRRCSSRAGDQRIAVKRTPLRTLEVFGQLKCGPDPGAQGNRPGSDRPRFSVKSSSLWTLRNFGDFNAAPDLGHF